MHNTSRYRKGLLEHLGTEPIVPGTEPRAAADVQGRHQSFESL